MSQIHSIAILHVGDANSIHSTLRTATQRQIDHHNVAFINVRYVWWYKYMLHHYSYILGQASLVYFADMATWDPVFHKLAVNLVQIAKGSKQFIRIDMFSVPLSNPWEHPEVSDDIKFLDFLPLVSLHAHTIPYACW